MAIKDNKKDLKLGMTVAEMVGNSDDNFTTLFDNQDDLQTQINGKEPKIASKGTAFNKNYSTANPQMDGTASPGTADNVARGDHKHPTDTTRLAASPDGTNTLLDENNKIRTIYLSDEILGQLAYQGVWDASKNTGAPATTKKKGDYYVCSVGGRYNPDGTAIATGAEAYAVGDWAVYNGTSWDKVDNTDAVTMVNGQIGSVKTYKGLFATATTYYQGDTVLGSDGLLYLYIATASKNNTALSDTTTWKAYGKLYTNATTTADGLMSAADKTNLDANTAARHTHSNKALLDTYDQTNANIKDAVDKKHTHTNKAILDNTTASYTEAEKTKLSKIDDSLLDKTFDEFGKVKDVTLDGTSVVDTNGVAVLKSAYHLILTSDNGQGTITQEEYDALAADNESYLVYNGRVYNLSQVTRTMLYFGSPVYNDQGSIKVSGIGIIKSDLRWTALDVNGEGQYNKSNDIAADKNNSLRYPSTKAVADYFAAQVKVTDVQKPDGTSLVTGGIAKLPNVNFTVITTTFAANAAQWVQKTVSGKTLYGLTVTPGFKAMLNANGEEMVYQLVYDSTSKVFTACIAEKQAVTIVTEAIIYA